MCAACDVYVCKLFINMHFDVLFISSLFCYMFYNMDNGLYIHKNIRRTKMYDVMVAKVDIKLNCTILYVLKI